MCVVTWCIGGGEEHTSSKSTVIALGVMCGGESAEASGVKSTERTEPKLQTSGSLDATVFSCLLISSICIFDWHRSPAGEAASLMLLSLLAVRAMFPCTCSESVPPPETRKWQRFLLDCARRPQDMGSSWDSLYLRVFDPGGRNSLCSCWL